MLLGVRLPVRYRPWVAATLRVYDDLRVRALKCAVLFLLGYAGAALLVGPRLFPGAAFSLAGAGLGLFLGTWFVGRSQRRRDLAYRLAGVHRDGTIDAYPPPNWAAWMNGASLVAAAVAVVAWTATPLGGRVRATLARIEGHCLAAPSPVQQRLVAAALPGTTFTGVREVQVAGRIFVVATVTLPRPQPPWRTGPTNGDAAWWMLPDFFGPQSGSLEPVNQAAANATPAAGLTSQHSIPYGNALRCASPARAAPTVIAPPVAPSVVAGTLIIHGPIELTQAIPAQQCGQVSSLTINAAGHTVSVGVTPPNAVIYIDSVPFSARGTVDADGIKVSGPVRASTPPTAMPAFLASPVGSAELFATCRT